MIPAKLQSGENFKSAVVRAVNAIIDHLAASRLVGDGRTVRVSQTCGGTQISVIAQPVAQGGGGGASPSPSAPTGMFDILCFMDGAAQKARILDSGDPSSQYAGYVVVGNRRVAVTQTDLTISGSGYIYVDLTVGATGLEAECAFASSLPTVQPYDQRAVFPLAHGSYGSFVRWHLLGPLAVSGRWT